MCIFVLTSAAAGGRRRRRRKKKFCLTHTNVCFCPQQSFWRVAGASFSILQMERRKGYQMGRLAPPARHNRTCRFVVISGTLQPFHLDDDLFISDFFLDFSFLFRLYFYYKVQITADIPQWVSSTESKHRPNQINI